MTVTGPLEHRSSVTAPFPPFRRHRPPPPPPIRVAVIEVVPTGTVALLHDSASQECRSFHVGLSVVAAAAIFDVTIGRTD